MFEVLRSQIHGISSLIMLASTALCAGDKNSCDYHVESAEALYSLLSDEYDRKHSDAFPEIHDYLVELSEDLTALKQKRKGL